MTSARWEAFPDRASARRAAAWSLHPDADGNADEFAAALDAIDRRFGVWRGVNPTEPIEILVRRTRRGSVQARIRAARRVYRRTRRRVRRRRFLWLSTTPIDKVHIRAAADVLRGTTFGRFR